MGRASIWLRKFDRDAAFIVERHFLFDGKKQRPGSIFDKALASTRRLRQLYENRQIRHADPGEVVVGVQETTVDNVPFGEGVQIGGDALPATPAPAEMVDTETASPLVAKHIGRGRYALTRDGERIDDVLYDSKAEAEAAIVGA